MRLVGYCTGCRKIRSVRVTGHELALSAARARIPQGVCTDCERREDEEQVERANARLSR